MKKTEIFSVALTVVIAVMFLLAIVHENNSYKNTKSRYIPQLDITCYNALQCKKGKASEDDLRDKSSQT